MWIDELMALPADRRRAMARGLVRGDGSDFSPVEVSEIRTDLNAHPWRERVISVHRTANAAKVARQRRLGHARWTTPGLTLHSRTLDLGDGATAVVAVWRPTTFYHDPQCDDAECVAARADLDAARGEAVETLRGLDAVLASAPGASA